MAETDFLKLYKKDSVLNRNDTFNITTMLNDNWDKLDTVLFNINKDKVDKITGKGLSTNDFTKLLKDKLDGIEVGANKYTHPDSHSLDIITETTTKKIMTNTERDKLEGVAVGANKYSHPLKHPPAIIDQDLNNRFISDLELAQIENNKTNLSTHLADGVSHVPYGVTTGTSNNYLVNLNPTPSTYTEGMALSVKINIDATGISTLNVNGLGAKGIKKANGSNVTNLKANGIYTLRYDGVNFILQGEGGSGNALASDLLLGKTASTDAGEITGTKNLNNLIPNNVKSGVNIGGIIGTLIDGTDRFKRASGVAVGVFNGALQKSEFTVEGLSFKPTHIMVFNEAKGSSGSTDLSAMAPPSFYGAGYSGGPTNKVTYLVAENGFTLRDTTSNNPFIKLGTNYHWFAFGL